MPASVRNSLVNQQNCGAFMSGYLCNWWLSWGWFHTRRIWTRLVWLNSGRGAERDAHRRDVDGIDPSASAKRRSANIDAPRGDIDDLISLHPLNADPRTLTLFAVIGIARIAVHPSSAASPMSISPEPNVSELIEPQLSNALLSIVIALAAKTTASTLGHQ